MPNGRRITNANIKFISLCRRGMNGLRTIYKSEEKSVVLQPLIKEADDFMERGQLVAAVWLPDRIDKEGDWSDATTIEKMCHSFAKNGMQLDMRHDENVLSRDDAFCAESFIIQKNDPRFENLTDYDGTPIGDPAGGWGAVLQINNPELRKAYREGRWGGVSMAGPAAFVDEEPPHSKTYQKMCSAVDGEDDVNEEQLAALLKKNNKDLIDGMASAVSTELTKALKPEGKEGGDAEPAEGEVEKSPTEIEFTGDPTDAEALRKHVAKVEFAKVDKSDPKALKKYIESLEVSDDEVAKDGDGEGDDKSPELLKAERDLAKAKTALSKARGQSNQTTEDPATDAVKKEEDRKAAIADMLSKANGTPKK